MWWDLPGPSARVDQIAQDLKIGKNVVVRPDVFTAGGYGSMIRSRVRDAFSAVSVLRVDGAADPAAALNHEFGILAPDVRPTAARLAEAGEFTQRLVWMELRGAIDANVWKSFIRDFGHACQARPEYERSLIAVDLEHAHDGDWPDGVCVGVHTLSGCADTLDMQLYVARRCAGDTGLVRKLRVSVIATLALWDPRAADALCEVQLDALSDPRPVLLAYARDRGWSDTTVSQLHGTLDGEGLLHSAAAAVAHDDATIAHRVWQGQLPVVFPLIENHRRLLGAKYRHLFNFPIQTDFGVVSSIEDVEIGVLEYYMRQRGAAKQDRELAAVLRDVRNKLAHFEPLSSALVRRLLTTAA
jgi:hypothetical protein